MPAIEVLSVSVPERLPDEVRAAQIRRPQPDTAAEVFTLDLAGTVLTHGGRAETVEVLCQGTVVREIPVNLPRTGLTDLDPDLPDTLDCGFRALLGALVLPPEFELELVAVREDGQRFRVGAITGRRERPAPSVEPAFRPLMLTSVGRTGTVLLMRILGAHPSVVVHEEHPYEVWPARYWGHMLQVLSGPADHARSVNTRNFDHDLWHVGQNPFYTPLPARLQGDVGLWLGRRHVERLAEFCRENVEEWYAILARDQGKNPLYFAEKNFAHVPIPSLGVADLYPETREVFSVRDLRDVACSMLSFLGERWRARGFDNERALREILAPWVQHLVSSWRARGEHAHLVRYEDLVRTPRETIEALLDYLEIDSSGRVVDRALKAAMDQHVFTSHGTSATLEGTVGRWSRDGDDSFGDTLNEIFHEALVEFGYVEAAAERA